MLIVFFFFFYEFLLFLSNFYVCVLYMITYINFIAAQGTQHLIRSGTHGSQGAPDQDTEVHSLSPLKENDV